MQYQVYNWYNFAWLSGDLLVERGTHDLDVINWIKRSHPIRAQGMGGRQVCIDKDHGDGMLYVDGQPQRFARRQTWHKNNPYPAEGHQVEMDEFLAALLAGRPYNEADYGATATMTGLLEKRNARARSEDRIASMRGEPESVILAEEEAAVDRSIAYCRDVLHLR